MKLFGKRKKKETQEQKGFYYNEEELDMLEKFIDENFGASGEVFHEIVSPDIHVDIYIIPPTEERNYYTLVTLGMGARRMDVPEQFREYNSGRAEIMVTLPPDWDIKSNEEENYWPLRWLKVLARLPITNDTWLGWGHTVPGGEPFARNTELAGVLLAGSYLKDELLYCEYPDGNDAVQFYHMIPLYEEEMNYKIANNTEALIEKLGPAFSHVVDIARPNACAE